MNNCNNLRENVKCLYPWELQGFFRMIAAHQAAVIFLLADAYDPNRTTDTLHRGEPITHRRNTIFEPKYVRFPGPDRLFRSPDPYAKNFFAGKPPGFCTIVCPAEQKPAKLAWIMLYYSSIINYQKIRKRRFDRGSAWRIIARQCSPTNY